MLDCSDKKKQTWFFLLDYAYKNNKLDFFFTFQEVNCTNQMAC